MASEGRIVTTRQEIRRLELIKRVIGKEMKQRKAAEILGISVRQTQRVIRRIKEEGEKGIVHRLRGRESNRRIREPKKERILKLYQERYAGFGPTLAAEKLAEREKINLSDETLRKWLIAQGEWEVRRGSREHREWRERKGQSGEMVQLDGSHHDWLEGRGPWMVLMGYIDDATGEVFGRFYEYEGTIPALDSLKRYMKKKGIPQSLYLDRHTTYKSTGEPTLEEELKGKKSQSQFERACEELGIEVIHAYSPQAKGRIERLFKTLQDRLVKEMRLDGVDSLNRANEFLEDYLPKHNARFSILAREKGDLHCRINDGSKLGRILCVKDTRKLRNDWTLVHEGQWYQVKDGTDATEVTVEQGLDRQIQIYDRDKKLKYIEIKQRTAPKQIRLTDFPFQLKRKHSKPGTNHPWRKLVLNNKKTRLMAKQAA